MRILILLVYINIIIGDESADNFDINPMIDKNGDFSIHMPGYVPEKDDDYVCTAFKAPPSYIREFHPFTHADRVHHMLIFGCDGDDFVLQQRIIKNCMSPAIYCSQTSVPRILYAWAKNAPSLILPDGIGTSIGHEGDGAQIIVMQMHFATPLQGNVKSYGGLTFHTQQERPPQISSVYLFVSGMSIPPQQDAFYINMSLKYNDNAPVRPIAYRTHAHTMGRIISAVVHHPDTDEFEIIGKRNPNWPQIFAPVDHLITIKKGDDLMATCRFDSSNKYKYTRMGMTHDAEMCNFYMMYAYNSSLTYDPLNTRQAMYGNNVDADLWPRYPEEARSLLPYNKSLEESALGTTVKFGVVDRGAWTQLGDQALGQVSGLAIDPTNDHLFVFHRGSRVWDMYAFHMNNKITTETTIKENTIIEVKFDSPTSNPTIVRSFGNELFYMPHSITVDNKRNLWLTDVGAHQVIKMSLQTDGSYRVSMTLGKKLQPTSGQDGFCKPTGVTSGPDDVIYVTDGYCNTRVMVFDANGNFKRQFETPTTHGAPHPPQLNLPHDIVIDTSASSLLIADRQNGRVLVTNYNGEYKGQILPTKAFDNVYSVDVNPMSKTAIFIPGEPPSRMANGKIQAFAANTDTNEIQYAFTPSTKNGDFNRPHVIRFNSDGRFIYTGELAQNKVRRFEITKDHTSFKHEKHEANHKETNTDESTEEKKAVPTKPISSNDNTNSSKVAGSNVANVFANYNMYLLFVILLSCITIGLVCLCRRPRINSKRNRLSGITHFKELGKASLLTTRDRKGFKPLRMDDVDAVELTSDESEDDMLFNKTPAR